MIKNKENSYLFMEDYAPMSQYIKKEDLKTLSNFIVKKFNDAIYMGQINEEGERGGESQNGVREVVKANE